MLNHGSLFSGIGGFDLASKWMGWKNVFHCEYDPFCQKVLKHHFPNSKLYKDVRTFDATNYLGRVDILTGGFPCQPFSSAGLRKGTEDERHLWPSMLRIIREVSPKYVVGENVRGLLNWSGGLVFEEVCADLEAEGYEVTPYLLPACGKNAPHRRDRIWFIANSNNGLCKQQNKELCTRGNSFDCSGKKTFADTFSNGLEHGKNEREVGSRQEKICRQGDKLTRKFKAKSEVNEWETFPTQPPLCGGDDGVSKGLDNITFSKWRKESIKAYGNAIVPQVAHEIFKAIQKMEDLENQQEEV